MINFQDKNGRSITLFHIPKNGGSTIAYGIFGSGLVGMRHRYWLVTSRRLRYGALHHNDEKSCKSGLSTNRFTHWIGNPRRRYSYEPGLFTDHFTYREAIKRGFKVHKHSIAFVRNPWQRCVSRFLYVKKYQLDPYDENITFEIFVKERILPNPKREWRPDGWRQQYEYLIDENNKIAVSDVYKIEDIDIFTLFEDMLGRPLRRKNVNEQKQYDYREFYTPSLVDEVAKIYADDIRHFGYEFVE